MSIAGMISIVDCPLRIVRRIPQTDDALLTRRPGYEICQQLKPPAPAFLGMELHGGQIIVDERAWEHDAVVSRAGDDLPVGQVAIERVNEVEVAAVGDAREQPVVARGAAI